MQFVAIGELNDLAPAKPGHEVRCEFWRHDLHEILFECPDVHRSPFMGLGLVRGDEGGRFADVLVPRQADCGDYAGAMTRVEAKR